MPKYHINQYGEPARCDAKIKCRLNAEDDHFHGTMRDAFDWAEQKNAETAGGSFGNSVNNTASSGLLYDSNSRESLEKAEKDWTWGERGEEVTERYLSDPRIEKGMSTKETIDFIDSYVKEGSSGALTQTEMDKIVDSAHEEYLSLVNPRDEYEDKQSFKDAMNMAIRYEAKHDISYAVRTKALKLQPLEERAEYIYKQKERYCTDEYYSEDSIRNSPVFDTPKQQARNAAWDVADTLNKTHGKLSSKEVGFLSSEAVSNFDKRSEEIGAGEAAKESLKYAIQRVVDSNKS